VPAHAKFKRNKLRCFIEHVAKLPKEKNDFLKIFLEFDENKENGDFNWMGVHQ
jgi:hypothetical protein